MGQTPSCSERGLAAEEAISTMAPFLGLTRKGQPLIMSSLFSPSPCQVVPGQPLTMSSLLSPETKGLLHWDRPLSVFKPMASKFNRMLKVPSSPRSGLALPAWSPVSMWNAHCSLDQTQMVLSL